MMKKINIRWSTRSFASNWNWFFCFHSRLLINVEFRWRKTNFWTRKKIQFFLSLKFANARTRYRSEESRVLHDDLVRQADERARVNKLDRYQSNVAELQVNIDGKNSIFSIDWFSSIHKRWIAGGEEVVVVRQHLTIADIMSVQHLKNLDKHG